MKQGLVRLLYNFGKRFMGWTLHMIMCVLLCYPVSIRIYYQQGVLFLVTLCGFVEVEVIVFFFCQTENDILRNSCSFQIDFISQNLCHQCVRKMANICSVLKMNICF